MKPIKVVVDTNVFIDAIFHNDQSCKSIFQYKQDKLIEFCMNEIMYKELILIFGRLLEANKLTKDMSRLVSFFGGTLWEIQRIEHKTKTQYCIDDEEDNKFIDCCIDGKIKYLITSDMHLREVTKNLEEIKDKYKIDLKIMSPYQFSRELLRLKY